MLISMLSLFNSSASDIFFPGTEDPTSILNWFLLYITKYPDLQAQIHRQLDDVIGNTSRLPEISDKPNLSYLEAFIAEVQRIVSETPLAVPHSTTRDTSLAGFFIPRDMTVFVNLWAIHHDPDRWEDPACFRPERFLDERGRFHSAEGFMPFSLGKRLEGKQFSYTPLDYCTDSNLSARLVSSCPARKTVRTGSYLIASPSRFAPKREETQIN